ncbi:sacsin [Patella vulgata]|uniref:sacsin n=1 Tax=Patella vulgata TaxID=6465 RepID=UPI0024A9D9B1|nr:sacsin [Patella vulgata]
MKTDELEWEHLPKRIRSVLHCERSELLINRTEKFLRYMTSTRDAKPRYQKCPDEIRKELSNLEFLTLQKPPCSWTLPWYGGDNTKWPFTSPINGYFPDCQHLVGCIKPVVDISKYTYNSKITDVLKWLGVQHLRIEIDLKLVIENLLIISNHTMESGLKNDGYLLLDAAFRDIYDYLRKVVEDNNEEDIDYIKQSLENKAVILHERTLKTADKMVMELRNSLSPYLFEVDQRYKRYKDLFVILGVPIALTLSMLIGALLLFAKEKGSTKLSSDEIDCINRLCNEFEGLCDQQTVDKRVFESIKLPDENSELTFTKDLYFDDSPWLSNDLTQTHLHKKISRSVAELMGVKSKRSHDIESLSSPLFSEFGQHEDLTNRIKRILEGYPCDESILKEMLQNADDAGATEVIFIKDFRQLETNSLPDDKLSQTQGPALCIYNNTCFSERDMKGIQALGLGSKSDEVLKTGQYGVGFNVVYHVTDVPSFWSKGSEIGELVCICDPHCKYLQSATERRPGSKIKVSGLTGRYTDFMEGYLPKITNKLDKGTLFRLPLRTGVMAATSEIRREVTTKQDIEDIITVLKRQIIPCMLFLENITKIKIASVNPNGDLNIEHEVSSKMTMEDTEEQKKYNNYLRKLSHKMGNLKSDSLSTPFEIQITLNLEESKSDKTEQFAIIKRVGFLPESKFPEKLSKAYDKGNVQKLPRGGVAINLSSDINGKAYCTLPLPIRTGLPVHINGQFALDHESRRNLRCEMDSVEGQWNAHLAKYVIVPAYISALNYLKDYPFNSRQTDLDVEKLKKAIDKFEKLFPTVEKATDIFWKDLSKDIYKWIARNKCPMFPVFTNNTNTWYNIKWVNIQVGDDGDFAGFFNVLHSYFNEHESTSCYRSSGIANMHNTMDKKTKTKDKLAKILVELGMMILKSSVLLLKQFKDSEIDVQTVTPENVLRFLKSYSQIGLNNRCKLDNLPCDISNTLFKTHETLKLVLQFVIKIEPKKNVDILYGAPLLLRQNNILETFNFERTVIVSKFCGLLPEHSCEFLAYDIIHLMETFLQSFKPLVEWNLQSFANLMQHSEEKIRICHGEIVPWDDNMPVSKKWLEKTWEFICGHLPSGCTRSKLSVSALEVINSFSLLPVQIGQRQVLYPLSLADHIMDMTNVSFSSTYQKVFDVLGELQIPKLLMISPFIIYELVVNIENPSAFLQLLIENIGHLREINIKQSETLWKYFNTKLDDMNNVTSVKILPIFQTHDGKMVSLCEGSKTYTCLRDSGDSVPKAGLQHWSSVSNVEIIRYHYDLENIFKKIGIQVNKPVDLYTSYILEHFHGFTCEEQVIHLQYIRDVLRYNLNPNETDRLIRKLKDVKFIQYNGTTMTASQFYDRDNKVFEVMGDHLIFPPPPFDHRDWKGFLILIGLQDEVSPEMFVQFAQIVENSGVTNQSQEQSRLLVTHLFGGVYIQDKQFCERIQNIKFVSRLTLSNKDIRSEIHPQYGCGDRFICLNGSFESSLVDYVWTVSNVLPTSVYFVQNNFLGIKIKINPSSFIDHLQNICSSLKDVNRIRKIDKASLVGIFTKLYEYMGHHTDINLSGLRDNHTIFLPDQMLMAKASKVIINPSKGHLIKGRIFQIPFDFVCYRQVFQALGAITTAVPDIYLEVLREIFTECDGKVLDPNLSTTVSDCIQQLNNLWKECPPNEYKMNEPHLYLPDTKTLMAKSTELIFVDNINIHRKVSKIPFRYFVGVKALKIEDCLMKAWPKKYQMKRLTKLIDVIIEPSCIDNATKGSKAQKIKNMLIDEYFINGVTRLLKHNQDEESTSDAKFDEALNKGIMLFIDIEVFEVNNLMTVLTYNDEVVPESNEPCPVHFKKSYNDNTVTYSLYVDKSKNVNSKLPIKLSDIIKRIFHIEIGYHFRDIWQLMVDESPQEIGSYLDKEDIKTDDFVSRYILFPPPGTCIPEKLHWLLDNSFNEFDKGDYVGYEIFDPDIEDVDGEGNITDPPYYIYAKIVGHIHEETDTEFASYSLDVGEDEYIQATVTRIYKFHRNITNNSRELVVSDERETEQQKSNTIEELDINTILNDIRQTMRRAWQCSDERERKRVTRRLLLLWHPDKNPNNVLKATEITKKIFMFVERLNRGLSLDDDSVPDETDGATRSQYYRSYERFYSNVYSTGRNHARYSQEQRSNRRYYNDNSFHTSARDEPNPSPRQAERWLKQADWDLIAAEQSLSSGACTHNWICYKCQQSAEKALKAVWYKIDANKVSQDHNLNSVANGLPYSTLVQLAAELQSTIGEHTRMRYPDKLSYPNIPHDAYNESVSTPACRLTRKIITISKEIIHG